MSGFVFILICSFIPSILTKCTWEESILHFRRSVYEYSLELLSRLAKKKDLHFVTSLLTSWTLLSCISFGSTDTTLTELRQVLKIQPRRCFHENVIEISRGITDINVTDKVMTRSSTIFIDEKMLMLNEFQRKVISACASNLELLPFDKAEATVKKINDYASEATHGIVNKVTTIADIENAVLIMFDAIYFKDSWKTPLKRTNIEVPFYNTKGVIQRVDNLRYISGMFRKRSVTRIKADIYELPYRHLTRYSMLVFLPFNNVSLYTVIDQLKQVRLTEIKKFDEIESDVVSLRIPRFKITSDFNDLTEVLKDMGLKEMFDSNEAKFQNIFDESIYASSFVERTDIEVTEKGTVISVVNESEDSFKSCLKHTTYEKPYAFMIIEKIIGVPIFVGAFSKLNVFNYN